MAKGLYFKEGWATVRFADGAEHDIPRYLYVKNQYEPAFEDLPRKVEAGVGLSPLRDMDAKAS